MSLNNYHLLEYFMDHVPDVIYFKDKKCRFILVNQAHANSIGLKPEEIIGKTDFDIFPRERAKRMFKDDLHVLNTRKPIIDKIERATRPDGVDNYVSTTKIPVYDEKGRVIGLLGITRDITRRVQIENIRKENESITRKLHELKESEKIKPQVVSIVSHELKTPLSIARESVKMVFEGRLGIVNHEQKKCLTMAMNNMDRIKKITGDLLDLSRIENKTLVLKYSLVDLKGMIKDLLPFFNKLALDKGISLECRFPEKQVNVFVDSDRIRQVFLNLINNAIKFTEENGKIKVEIKIFDNKIRVGVIDNGIGIAKEDIPRLFKKFVQLCQEKCVDRTGVGLGLAISKQLIESHGGDVWVESKAGIGSKFYFTLPLCYAVNR
jgi:PAS domain S-box-containing protein